MLSCGFPVVFGSVVNADADTLTWHVDADADAAASSFLKVTTRL